MNTLTLKQSELFKEIDTSLKKKKKKFQQVFHKYLSAT